MIDPRALVVAALTLTTAAAAQAQTRYLLDPSAGLALPLSPLAGEADATSVVRNPGSMLFLGGYHLGLAYGEGVEDDPVGAGEGLGFYAATPVAIPFLPRFALGFAAERLTPPRVVWDAEPGRPSRLSFALAGQWAGLGVGATWHHFLADGGPSRGLDTFDLGVSGRLGAHFSAGLALRDLFAPLAGDIPIQRRWELEVGTRPWGDDRFELAASLALAERRGDVDPGVRASVRLARGVHLRAAGEVRSLWVVDPAFPELAGERVRDFRASLGLEVSLGGVGVTGWGGVARSSSGTRFAGAGGLLRWSGERLPSLIGAEERIVRLRLEDIESDRQLARVLLLLRRLEKEPGVRAVLVSIGNLDAGWGSLQEMRAAFHRLRKSGKKVYAYLVAGTSRDYYLAAAADRVYLDAAGGLRLVGLSSTVLYFKNVFDRLGVLAQFEKIEEYKSAPEAYTRAEGSEPARAMRDELFDDIWGQMVGDIARDRQMTPDEVRRIFDDGPYTAGDAAKTRLVDAVVEPEDIDGLVSRDLRGRVGVTDTLPRERPRRWSLPRVAVVFLEGDIVDGRSQTIPILDQRLAGGDTLSASLAWARGNPDIRAVVLRINSPGGSALASELIAREVHATRGRKPIIVSMGDVAASGGYFAAAPGDVILTDPGTLTGSIGIFTGKFDVSGLAARIGLTWETETRGRRADMESFYRPYSAEERALIKEKLRYFYGRFVKTVARGRGMKEAEVDAVGRGHVWTGRQALGHKLADRSGGLIDAILEAKRHAGLGADEPVELVFLPVEPQGIVKQILRLAGGDADLGVVSVSVPAELRVPVSSSGFTLPPALVELARQLPMSLVFGKTASPQARLPYLIDLK